MYNKRQTYRCGGYGSYNGHCGALDCETCHPGGAAELARQEAQESIEILQGQIDDLAEEMAQVADDLGKDSEEYQALARRMESLNEELYAYDEPGEPDYEAIAEARAEARAERYYDDW
jgi:predicted  nucleic acid-binding Zn-ribbon protein